jgi:hypothetical protein
MPDRSRMSHLQRVELALGLLIAVDSFAPWWRRRTDGKTSAAWTGPHLSWLPVLLCMAVVVGRTIARTRFGERWAATGTAVAIATAGWGGLIELTQQGSSLDAALK